MNFKILRFLGIALLFYSSWYVSYEFWIRDNTLLDYYLTVSETRASQFVFDILGYDSTFEPFKERCQIYFNSYHVLNVGHECNALEVFVIFTGFIICFPGSIRSKAFFIPLGILTIYGLNIARIVALTLIAYYTPEYLDFNHKYTFNVIIHGVIFFLWYNWSNKHSFK